MKDTTSLTRIAKGISGTIEDKLSSVGLLYRIFYRAKDSTSIDEKISLKKYATTNKKLQDAIGIRIAAYFHDDLNIISKIINDCFTCENNTIDELSDSQFSPERMNYVFKVPNAYIDEFNICVSSNYIDSTFEIQIRTVLSEGWHEVEHDMRYKCKEDWDGYKDESRVLNGIWATLSNCDWAMMTLFDQLAYNNYKNHEWTSLVRNKFRIRISNIKLSEDISSYMSNEDNGFSKKIFKTNRDYILDIIYTNKLHIPLNANNVIYLINYFIIKDKYISSITPVQLLEIFKLPAQR